MRITSTKISLASAHFELQAKRHTTTSVHRSSMMKLLIVMFFTLTIITGSLKAQTHTMAAGSYALTGSVTYYDPGGAGGTTCPGSGAGNYGDNLNITETITANLGQRIVVTFVGGTFGISSSDVLTVYDGPTTASPVLASYTNTAAPVPSILGATTSNSITFLFTTNSSLNCKGWQATVAAYYYMQPGSYSFTCPGTYTFLDPQQPNSGGSGGDPTCVANGNSKDYQDNLSMIESFTTTNGQCIQIDGSFPNNFGICSLDTLTVYDGPSILSPIANGGTAVYTNTWANPPSYPTLGSTATFKFFSDANNTHTRGWQIALSCVACPSASINDLCANAIILTAAASCNNLASSSSVSNSNASPFLAPLCTGANTANDDVWYRFTANNSTTQITVAATDGSMDPVIQLFSGTCGSFTSLYCQNATGVGGTETINATGLTVGTTYYFRVYDANTTNASHTFNVCVVGAANTDCQAAQQVCNTSALQHTAQGYPDYGTQEYNSSYWSCDFAGEIRSAWYYFQLATSGTFGFTVSGVLQTAADYQDCDFVLWGPLSGLNCPMNTQPIRCDYSISYFNNSYGVPHWSTGLESGEGDQISNAGGNAFVQTVNGTAGQWYVLMVNIFGGQPSYNLTWMDNIPANQQATFTNCILPINLVSFTGESVGLQNILNWSTASENNNDYFAIERSSDGEHFTQLGTLAAAGNTLTGMKYNFPDQSPLNGINYYRLRQTDFDGTFTYSNTIALKNGLSNSLVPFVYPNPSAGVFNISISAIENTDVTLQVFNAVGQLITSTEEQVKSGDNRFTVDLSSNLQGIYTLFLRDSHTGKVYASKIVKL